MEALKFDRKKMVGWDKGCVVATSLTVAKYFGKRHADVLRAINRLDCSIDFNQRNFALVEYLDDKGEKRPICTMTKDGFMFLVMGFSGKQSAAIKEAYINAFNEMEAELSSLTQQYATTSKAFEQASDVASKAGKTLCIVGKQHKPPLKAKRDALANQLQRCFEFHTAANDEIEV